MPNYNFTLVIDGADLQGDEVQDALFEMGCDDATFGVIDGVQYAEFDREAASYGDALISAMADIKGAVPQARVVHVEPDELVTAAEIAERLNRSREWVRLVIAGDRGPGDFPAPVSHVRTRSRLWRWPEVLLWVASRYEDEYGDVFVKTGQDSRVTAMVNGYLAYRRYMDSLNETERRQLEEAAG